MAKKDDLNWMPLAEAAMVMKLSYEQALDLVLQGKLKGRKGRGGWQVTVVGVAREAERKENTEKANQQRFAL